MAATKAGASLTGGGRAPFFRYAGRLEAFSALALGWRRTSSGGCPSSTAVRVRVNMVARPSRLPPVQRARQLQMIGLSMAAWAISSSEGVS